MNQKSKRKSVEYDGNTPRCKTCRHFKDGRRELLNSIPVAEIPPWCKENQFPIRAGGLCRLWINPQGETLEEAPT